MKDSGYAANTKVSIGHWLQPQVELAYALGKMPRLALPAAPDESDEADA